MARRPGRLASSRKSLTENCKSQHDPSGRPFHDNDSEASRFTAFRATRRALFRQDSRSLAAATTPLETRAICVGRLHGGQKSGPGHERTPTADHCLDDTPIAHSRISHLASVGRAGRRSFPPVKSPCQTEAVFSAHERDSLAGGRDGQNPVVGQKHMRRVVHAAWRSGDDRDLPPLRKLLVARQLQRDRVGRHLRHAESDGLQHCL